MGIGRWPFALGFRFSASGEVFFWQNRIITDTPRNGKPLFRDSNPPLYNPIRMKISPHSVHVQINS